MLNNVLLPAMKEVGDKFGAGELILPFVLQSAEVMKKAVAHLEQFLERKEGVTKGKVVLATVFGDVHDIGKNLVNTILSNNGYTVYDLGKQVPMNTILDKAVEVDADAIGLSALLVSTSKQMPRCVQEQDARGLAYPVVVGGAAINRDFGRRIAYAADERFFEPGVFYAKDAFEGLDLMDALTGETRARAARRAGARRGRGAAREGRRRARRAGGRRPHRARRRRRSPTCRRRRSWARARWRTSTRASCGRASTSRASTGSRGAARTPKAPSGTRLVATSSSRGCARYQAMAEREPFLEPRVVYGYFPAAGRGDDVIVYDPQRPHARDRALHLRAPDSAASICAWPTTCASRATAARAT